MNTHLGVRQDGWTAGHAMPCGERQGLFDRNVNPHEKKKRDACTPYLGQKFYVKIGFRSRVRLYHRRRLLANVDSLKRLISTHNTSY